MIYQYTGQPGHGKTLHAIDKALEWVEEGREVYACNIRAFKAAKAGMIEITPEQFKTWQDWAPDGAAFLVDECYEHGMLPKRAPATTVPPHVEQLAKHRHRGLDFIFVAQSPTKQMDVFVHDLIERHVHVRRRFGTFFVHLRIFDRFESNPAKAHPLILQRVRLPKRPMGLYESTKLDTTERKIPWYYPAAVVVIFIIAGGVIFSWRRIAYAFDPNRQTAGATPPGGNGAGATVTPGGGGLGGKRSLGTAEDYASLHTPRFPKMPWSAPVFDDRAVKAEPSLACWITEDMPCRCVTEQGSRYVISELDCRDIVKNGMPYNPYRGPDGNRSSGLADSGRREPRQQPQGRPVAAAVVAGGDASTEYQQARYGQMRTDPIGKDPPYEGVSF